MASTVKVKPADFKTFGKKLERLCSTLTAAENNIFQFLIGRAAPGPAPKGIKIHFKYKPRGAKALVAGGSDGLTILINSKGKITIVPPEGPLPTDMGTFIGAFGVSGG